MRRYFIDRRDVLGAMVGAAGLVNLPTRAAGLDDEKRLAGGVFDWRQAAARPKFVWENLEDVFYHDLSYEEAELNTSPEMVALAQRPWVFNRAMQWQTDSSGTVLCYTAAGDLPLTGEQQVSRWFSDPRNSIVAVDGHNRFVKKTPTRYRDCAILPAFQFHLGQQPVLAFDISHADADWQVCVSIKGRAGPPLLDSGWKQGPGHVRFDIASALQQRGYANNFAELHIVIGVWHEDRRRESSVLWTARLIAQPALIGCLPVIRTVKSAAGGVPVSAIAVDAAGRSLTGKAVKLTADVAGRQTVLVEQNGTWTGLVQDLGPGDHRLILTCTGAFAATTKIDLRVCDTPYWTLDKARHLMARDGRVAGPLNGSFQGTFLFRDVGLPTERQIIGQADWDQWDRSPPPGERMHWWEAMTPAELATRFAYLGENGWDVVYLHQHWGFWERLDAGGRIAPHGAEQFALYTRSAGRHGVATMMALSSYPYSASVPDKTAPPTPEEGGGTTNGTIVFSTYTEAGFKNRDWFYPDAGRRFDGMFAAYLRQFALLFGDETNMLGMTAGGEGDKWNGVARSTATFKTIRSHDPDHLFLAEPIHQMKRQPTLDVKGWTQDLSSGRSYWIGEALDPETDLGVEFKIYQRWGLYLAEGSWPANNPYNHLNALVGSIYGKGASWIGTERYRTRIRDSFYLGLVHRLPLIMTWDEKLTEDEHKILRAVRGLIDWTTTWEAPRIGVRIDDSNILSKSEGRRNLGRFEAYFASSGLSYVILSGDEPAPANMAVVFDARLPFAAPVWGQSLPDDLRMAQLLTASPGYATASCRSRDRRTMIGYVYNVSGHAVDEQALTGKYHRLPALTPLSLRLPNPPALPARYRLYNLSTRERLREGRVADLQPITFASTPDDYLFIMTPEN